MGARSRSAQRTGTSKGSSTSGPTMSADSRALAQKGSDGLRIKGGPISAQMAVEPVEVDIAKAVQRGVVAEFDITGKTELGLD